MSVEIGVCMSAAVGGAGVNCCSCEWSVVTVCVDGPCAVPLCVEPRIDNGVTTVPVGVSCSEVGSVDDVFSYACVCRLSELPFVSLVGRCCWAVIGVLTDAAPTEDSCTEIMTGTHDREK